MQYTLKLNLESIEGYEYFAEFLENIGDKSLISFDKIRCVFSQDCIRSYIDLCYALAPSNHFKTLELTKSDFQIDPHSEDLMLPFVRTVKDTNLWLKCQE
jgi:hypothetical protein